MKILALDFSSSQRSVAVWNDNAVASEVVDAAPGRDMKPFALIEAALEQAGLGREAIECLAVGIGPGSYTGIRVAISLAQGWQLAVGVKLLGISSVGCVAAAGLAAGMTGKFSVVVDAQRGELYLAGYEVRNGGAEQSAPLKLATILEAQGREHVGEVLIGPEATRWFPRGRVVFPQAATLARLAQARTDFLSGEKLEPIYLRETTFIKAPPARSIPGLTPD